MKPKEKEKKEKRKKHGEPKKSSGRDGGQRNSK
jgi:hypothetical protein